MEQVPPEVVDASSGVNSVTPQPIILVFIFVSFRRLNHQSVLAARAAAHEKDPKNVPAPPGAPFRMNFNGFNKMRARPANSPSNTKPDSLGQHRVPNAVPCLWDGVAMAGVWGGGAARPLEIQPPLIVQRLWEGDHLHQRTCPATNDSPVQAAFLACLACCTSGIPFPKTCMPHDDEIGRGIHGARSEDSNRAQRARRPRALE